jgi:hypothetical protein
LLSLSSVEEHVIGIPQCDWFGLSNT